ncbi:transposase, partial [Bradyrhizobium sp. WSM1253]|uniref:transposase n=1 Tax=Bradyrhizobium sp. WSM1253 TaxID=319003 RepID=UPI001FD8E490
ATIRALSASERTRRPDGPSRTSSRLTDPLVEPSKWTSFLLSNPIPNLRPSRRLLSHVHSNSEARVSASRLHFAEFGVIVGQGRQRVDGLVQMLDDDQLSLPTTARMALAALVNQMKEVDRQIEAIERELAQIQRAHPVARLLASIPGVGPITATALAATVPDPTMFRSEREFAAWLGLTPRQNSTGGKDRLAT